MTDLQFIVQQELYADINVDLWKMGEKLSNPLWSSVRGDNYADHEFPRLSESPRAFLAVDDQLFMGMSSGYIYQIDLHDGRTVARYGPRLTMGHGEPALAPIRGLVLYQGKVHDGSAAGLFETVERKRLDKRMIGSVEVAAGKLLIVPHGEVHIYPGRPTRKVLREATIDTYAPINVVIEDPHIGGLVDVSNGEVIMEDVEPFDGSGMSPGEHCIVGDYVYMHHGNHPGETITIRRFPTGEKVTSYNILTTRLFGEHDGQAIDYRRGLGPNAIRRTDKDYDFPPLFAEPRGEMITSAASLGEEGLLVVLHDGQKNSSRIIHHQRPGENLIEGLGRMKITRI